MSFSFLEALSEESKDDVFDSIACPNTFEDDSQVDRFFDTHKSTPSPKLRRSQRLKEKQSTAEEKAPQPVKKVVEIKTPPKKSSATSYASCSSSTPYATPSFDLTKAATTPGPPPKSLLKVAIGNSLRKKAIDDDVTIVVAPKRTGPKTSTPRVVTKVAKENRNPGPAEQPSTVKKALRKSSHSAVNANTVVKSEAVRAMVRRTISSAAAKSAARSAVSNTQRFVAPRVDLAPSRAASVKKTSNAATIEAEQQSQKPTKSIGQKFAPERTVKRRSLKTIDKKRQSGTKKTEAIKNRVAAARKAATENRTAAKPQGALAGQYNHVKSKVAAMINNGPAMQGPNMRDMRRRAADLKDSKKVLHDKPFIPAGKVKYNADVGVVSGDLTVNGQTMAQFVKNFQFRTPPRYRSLKPTDKFQNTCVNHRVQTQKSTIAKSPKFATKDRRRNAVKQK